MNLNPAVTSSLSDLFINLSAGWLGVAVIIPPVLVKKNKTSYVLLFVDILFAILALWVGIYLRKI